jgi:hypothetical protein
MSSRFRPTTMWCQSESTPEATTAAFEASRKLCTTSG